MEERRKTDKLIWWMMVTFAGIVIVGGSAWCSMITAKVDKIAPLEMNVQFIQEDVNSIKQMMIDVIKKQEEK